ncbi:MAG: NAD-dependent deacylase [Deltaproteobacteria bacterium]|nr:NAD-dependent deacylase [Deltaproteobacteria bacterium]
MIFILTGAGISRESGIDTFRDKGGLWEKVRVDDVATLRGFRKDPKRVYEFYDMRRRELASGKILPNPAHLALARLEQSGREVFLVTQNVDDLHERAGSRNVVHMHGELLKALCSLCGASSRWEGDLGGGDACPACGRSGGLRPDVVWFGEMPYRMDEIEFACSRADVFVSIGTSGAVYPAAGLVRIAKAHGASSLEINLEPSLTAGSFDGGRYGPASRTVPEWVEQLACKIM